MGAEICHILRISYLCIIMLCTVFMGLVNLTTTYDYYNTQYVRSSIFKNGELCYRIARLMIQLGTICGQVRIHHPN